MAGKCKGKWNSWVNVKDFPPKDPPNDGEHTIGEEDETGSFKGKHKKTAPPPPPFDLVGFCEKTSSSHHIRFLTKEGFAYEGEITEREVKGKKTDVAEGTRTKTGKGKKANGGEEWVAVKVSN